MSDETPEASAAVWPRVVKLSHPIEFDDERITELSFRRGRLGDLKGMSVEEVPPMDKIMLLASRMCGKQVGVIERIDGDDATEVLEIALGFFGACLQGGPTR